eukprot:Nk52_evm2s322 gene=Nk52_evmTU2s322
MADAENSDAPPAEEPVPAEEPEAETKVEAEAEGEGEAEVEAEEKKEEVEAEGGGGEEEGAVEGEEEGGGEEKEAGEGEGGGGEGEEGEGKGEEGEGKEGETEEGETNEEETKEGETKGGEEGGGEDGESKGEEEGETQGEEEEAPKKKEPKFKFPEALTDGMYPIFMSGQSCGIFKCVIDEDVTVAKPWAIITREAVMEDFHNRAAVSDFHPLKDIVKGTKEEEFIIVMDEAFAHGENFIVAIGAEAKESLFVKPKVREGGEGGAGEDGEEEDEEGGEKQSALPPPKPAPKPWVSQGSELEIEEEQLVRNTNPISIVLTRKRRLFGASFCFEPRESKDVKDGYIECRSFKDPNYEVLMVEHHAGVQAIEEVAEIGVQTVWKYPQNKSVQYEPRTMPEVEKEMILESDEMLDFIDSKMYTFEKALQQNETMDIIRDDFMDLAKEDAALGLKTDNYMKEYQSFTDLRFSKDKSITCIDWHPSLFGIVAISCADKLCFDEKVAKSSKVTSCSSIILIWSFADPIHPQLILEAPDDIYSFKFNPCNPNMIAGGCTNGQVILWDISEYEDRLLNKPSANVNLMDGENSGDQQEVKEVKSPIVRYTVVSSIESSHKCTIADLQWIPSHLEIISNGTICQNPDNDCNQLCTIATDGVVLFWDIRQKKELKALDHLWKPYLRIPLSKQDVAGDFGATKMNIAEVQGINTSLDFDDEQERKREPKSVQWSPTGGIDDKRKLIVLDSVSSHFYFGTEEGDVVYADWRSDKDAEAKGSSMKIEQVFNGHFGPVTAIQRSPFFKDIVLSVGGWTFSIWKESVTSAPLLASPCSSSVNTFGFWSLTRPGVFFICKANGEIDVWDLLDRSHEPSMSQTVSSSAIKYMYPMNILSKQPSQQQQQQSGDDENNSNNNAPGTDEENSTPPPPPPEGDELVEEQNEEKEEEKEESEEKNNPPLLAVGDDSGTLHIVELPLSLTKPTAGEVNTVEAFFEREMQRIAYMEERAVQRASQKDAGVVDAETMKKQLTNKEKEEEGKAIKEKLDLEFKEFLSLEAEFLESLGIKPRTPTPTGDADEDNTAANQEKEEEEEEPAEH